MTEQRFLDRLAGADLIGRTGRVRKILPTYIEADGPSLPIGALCSVETRGAPMLAQVTAVHQETIILTPFEDRAPTFFGALVTASTGVDLHPVGDGFAGRAVDALGRPIDGLGPVSGKVMAPLSARRTAPLDRTTPQTILETGVRAIDGLLTLGHGQRVGIFAASGVGKTSLLAQLANQVKADHCVICLVGERGREVEALWSHGLSSAAKARTALVAATSDEAAAMRARACEYALALAGYWRSQGKHVLLLLDSVTRLAMALREIGLAAGEPPTVRAYTPGVFAAIPRLVEQCGALKSGGSITALMTVLSETDDVDDPISELMRSLLDGHIVLSRTLAEQGRFPAIDVTRSMSRLASGLRSTEHQSDAEAILGVLGAYDEARVLIETGVYAAGASPDVDHAIERRPSVMAFLQQPQSKNVAFGDCRKAMTDLRARRAAP